MTACLNICLINFENAVSQIAAKLGSDTLLQKASAFVNVGHFYSSTIFAGKPCRPLRLSTVRVGSQPCPKTLDFGGSDCQLKTL